MKKILLIIGIFLMLTGCSNHSDSLVLVTEAGFAPYEFYKNGEIVGFDIDLTRKIADRLGKKLIIKDIAFDSIISEIKTGKADIGAAGISYNEERQKQVDFTINYLDSKQVLVVRKNSNYQSIMDLKKSKVAVQLGTVADTYLTANYKDITLVREKKYLAAIADLKDGKVEAVVMDELPAKKMVDSNLKILSKYVTSDSYGLIVKKDNKELLETANKVIQELKYNGEIEKMLLKYMGE